MAGKDKKDMDLARKIWLAGIGAYGRAFDEAQDAYAKMGKETARVFDELVHKGEDLEGKVTEVAKKYVPEVAEKQRAQFEDRMERMKSALGLGLGAMVPAAEDGDRLAAVEARLAAMEGKLDRLLAALGASAPAKPAAKPAAKPRPRKPAAKKPTA